MFEPRPLGLRRGHWSDRHGVIERDPTLALSGPLLDPGDIAAYGAVEKHGPQVPALGQRRAEVRHSRPAEQAGPLRRQAVAEALSRQMSIGHFRAQNLPRAATIHEQKQWSSTVSRRANRQYRI
jgi:hypothetical protein